MANLITMPNQTPGLIENFLNQFNANQRSRGEDAFRQSQIDVEGRNAAVNERNATVNEGQLATQQGTLEHTRQLTQAKMLLDGWQKRMDEGDPTVQTEAQQYIAEHPESKSYLAAAALYHASQSQQAQGAAQGKHLADTQAVAAGATNPNLVNQYTYDVTSGGEPGKGNFMPPEGFKQQQATDLQSRQASTPASVPNLKNRIPAPSGNAVSDFEARSTEAMPTSAQNQTAQTQITTEGMRQKGETERKKMDLSAVGAEAGDRDVKSTASGKQYADVSMYGGKTKNLLVAHYRDKGVPVLDRKDVDAIREIDNARLNQKLIADTFLQRLPKDPTGRVMGGAVEQQLSKFFQTDEFLAASGALRSAAIQALRATAGAKGLRLNQAEIALAVDNDIPKITDTVGTAQHKIMLIAGMLDSAEDATLGTFTGNILTANGGGANAPSPGESWARKFMGSMQQNQNSGNPQP